MQVQRQWQVAESSWRAGDLAAARIACDAILALAPDHPAAHWMLCGIHQAHGRMRLAARHARLSAATAERMSLQQRLMVARALVGVGAYRRAAAILGAIGTHEVAGTAELTEIAELFNMLDMSAQADAWLGVAQARGCRSPTLALLRGNHRKFAGDLDGAAGAYEEAIAAAPAWPHPYLALATLSLHARAEANAARIRKAIGAIPPSGPRATAPAQAIDLAAFHYALFRELDTIGDIDGAWAALERAMALRRPLARYDHGREDALYDRLLSTCDAAFVRPAAGADAGAAPIFIVGLPRSGTTLVERVLGNHSAVAACGELNDLRMQYKLASDHYCPGFLDQVAAERFARVDAATLGRAYLQATSWRTGGKPRYTDKHPGNFVFSGLILRALPGARIIHVRRDPAAGAFAVLREVFAPGFYDYSYALEDVAHHHRNYSRLMAHVGALADGRILDVQYEAFVRDPAGQAARILAFCGLGHEPGIDDVSRNTAPVTTASSVQVREPIHTRRIDYWRQYRRHLEPLLQGLGSSG